MKITKETTETTTPQFETKRLDSQQKLGKCKICNGNDADIPCAYTTEKPDGCLRAARLNSQPVPVEPDFDLKHFIAAVKDTHALSINCSTRLLKTVIDYIDTLQSELRRVTEERDAKDRLITNYEEWLSVCGENAKELQERAEAAEAKIVQLEREIGQLNGDIPYGN